MMHLKRREFLATSSIIAGCAIAPHSFAQTSKDVSWLAEIQRPPEKLPADLPRLTELLVNASGKQITISFNLPRAAITEMIKKQIPAT